MTIGTFPEAEPPASGLARPGSRVLLAGTARHPDGSPLPDVPAVARSLTDLAAVLRDQAGIGAENLGEPLIDPSGPLALGQALDRAASEATDTLLVYYAGHGLIGSDQELYLATSATDSLVDGLDFKALSYRTLLRSLQKSRARTVVVVLDCCFSDRGWPPTRLPTDAVFERTLVHGGFLLTSAARDELALAAAGERHTRFTGALIGLLRDGDPAGPRGLTLEHAYRFLDRELPDGTPRPHRHSTDGAGELVLASNPAYSFRLTEESDGWRPGDSLSDADAAPSAALGAGPPCPFRGLRSFGPEDAGYFFGRDDLIRQVTRCVNGADGLHAVIGPSGSGKTSLLRAGAVPRLLEQGWRVAVMTPGGDPLATLAGRWDALSGSGRLLVVDQFEELFAAEVAEDDRKRFLHRLARLPAVVIVLRADFYGQCLRYPELVRALQENQVIVGPMNKDDLRVMIRQSADTAGLRLEHGLADTLLSEVGARETRNQAAALPLLSHALQETWLRRSGNLLTLAGYRDTGGIEKAIGQAAQEVYDDMDAAGQSRMRDLLLRMVRLGDDTEDTRRQLPLAQLSVPDRRILDALAGARLAVIGDEQAELAHDAMLYAWPRLREWIKENRATLLAAGQLEDAARAWEQAGGGDEYLYPGARLAAAEETLAGAGTTLRPGERTRRFIEASRGRQRAEQQAAARRRRRRRVVLSVICALVLAAGTVSVISVQQHASAVRHAAVIQSSDLAADAAALQSTDPGLAAQLSVAAYQTSPTEAAATQLYASASLPVDSTVGSVGQRVVAVTAQADGHLVAASDAGGRLLHVWNIANPSAPVLQAEITLHLPAGKYTTLALAPQRPLLVALCSASAVCLWNVAKRGTPAVAGQIPRFTGPNGPARITSTVISPDGQLLALSTMNAGTLLYTIASPAHPRLLADLPDIPAKPGNWLGAAAFSPDGRLLAETVQTGTTKLWSLTDPARPEQAASIASGYQDVTFSPDGTLLAAVGDTSIGLWNITRATRPSSVPISSADTGTVTGTYSEDLRAVAFTPDGRYLAYTGDPVGGGDGLGMLGLLNVSPASLSNPIPVIENIGFGNASMAPTGGDALLTGGADGVVRLWRTAEPEAADTQAGGPTDWSVSGGGHLMAAPVQLANGPADTPDTGIWDISGKIPVLDATLPVDPATAAFLGNASDALLTVDLDGGVTLWNVTDPRHPVRAAALGSAVLSDVSQWSPDGVVTSDTTGTLIAVLGANGTLRLWRVGKGPRVTLAGSIPVPAPRTDLAGVLPDGQHAVIITNQGLQWWDITDPAHPARIGSSPMATANKGSGTGGGSLFAETAQIDDLCDCSKLDIFSLSGRHVSSSATLSGQAGGQLEVSNDGRLLASAGAGGNGLTLWDLRDPGHPRELAALQTVPTITGITFSPNDALLADWNEQTLQLWNLRDPASPALVASIAFLAQPFVGNTEYEVLGGAEFASSGGTLAVSANYSVVFLDTDPAAAARRLCSVTGAAITRAQWQLYAPGISYQEPCRGSSEET
jgi:WD40 repeat protein